MFNYYFYIANFFAMILVFWMDVFVCMGGIKLEGDEF